MKGQLRIEVKGNIVAVRIYKSKSQRERSIIQIVQKYGLKNKSYSVIIIPNDNETTRQYLKHIGGGGQYVDSGNGNLLLPAY